MPRAGAVSVSRLRSTVATPAACTSRTRRVHIPVHVNVHQRPVNVHVELTIAINSPRPNHGTVNAATRTRHFGLATEHDGAKYSWIDRLPPAPSASDRAAAAHRRSRRCGE